MEIPVYLFTGFLEAGKTSFIKETLSDPKFNEGERMLVILCEEGEEELDLSTLPYSGLNLTITRFDEEQMMTPDRFLAMKKRARAERVLIEYNGMWNIDSLFEALPDTWFVCEEISLFNAETIKTYNANMRQLVVDKISNAGMVVFNRVTEDMDMEFMHKLVRSITRQASIGYEYTDGTFVPDKIEDPLPFDLKAPVVEIQDRDYAIWYAHLTENMEQYDQKVVRFLGRIERNKAMGNEYMAIGREIMVCCEADIAYRPLVARYAHVNQCKSGQWVQVTGTIKLENNPFYEAKGPVLYANEIKTVEPPKELVATFY